MRAMLCARRRPLPVQTRRIRSFGCGGSREAAVPRCGVLFEALVGDTERREPSVEEVGIAVAIVLEGFGRGVVLAAVEFDDEVVGSVDGVDFVAGYLLISLGEREAVAFEEAHEVVFEVGAVAVAPRSGVRVRYAALDIG